MDAGPILAQEEVAIGPSDSFSDVEEKLCVAGARQLLTVIRQYASGTVTKRAQDASEVTFATKVDPALAQLDWTLSAVDLERRVRAFTPRPGAWCRIRLGGKVKRLKVLCARATKSKEALPGQTLAYTKQGWVVGCQQGALCILGLQVEGKKAMSIVEFISGVQSPPSILVGRGA